MPARARRPSFKPLSPRELDELNAIRLDGHLSYRVIAGQVALPCSTVQRAFKGLNKRGVDLTVHRLRLWLSARREERAARIEAERAEMRLAAAGSEA